MSKLGTVSPIELTLAVSLTSLVLTLLGIVVAAFTLRKLQLEVRKLQRELKEGSKVIIEPTLDEIIRVNGDIERAYRRRRIARLAKERRPDKSEEDLRSDFGPVIMALVGFLVLPIRYFVFVCVGSSMKIPAATLAKLRRCEQVINALRIVAALAATFAALAIADLASISDKEFVVMASLLSLGLVTMIAIGIGSLERPKEPKSGELKTRRRGRSIDALCVVENEGATPIFGLMIFSLMISDREVRRKKVEVALAPGEAEEVEVTFGDLDSNARFWVLDRWRSCLPEMPGVEIWEDGTILASDWREIVAAH